MGLSRAGTLQNRSLSMAYVPQNLSEGERRRLPWFWSALRWWGCASERSRAANVVR